MSLSAEEMRMLAEAGLKADQLVLVAELLEKRSEKYEEQKRKARDRKRKQRELDEDVSRDSHATVSGQGRDSHTQGVSLPLKEVSPAPLQETNPIPSPKENPPKGGQKKKFSLPEWVNPEDWKDFEEHRNRRRKPMTDKARERNLAKLLRFRNDGEDPTEVIGLAIERGWDGFFTTKNRDGPYANQAFSETAEQQMERLRRERQNGK